MDNCISVKVWNVITHTCINITWMMLIQSDPIRCDLSCDNCRGKPVAHYIHTRRWSKMLWAEITAAPSLLWSTFVVPIYREVRFTSVDGYPPTTSNWIRAHRQSATFLFNIVYSRSYECFVWRHQDIAWTDADPSTGWPPVIHGE